MSKCSCYSKVDGHVQNSRRGAGFILHISRFHKYGFLLRNAGASPPTGMHGQHSMLLFQFTCRTTREVDWVGRGMYMRKEKCIQSFGEET